MPTTKTTITITDLQDAAGNLLGNAWLTVRLNAGGNAVEVDGVAVAKTAKVQTDADGDASIQLYPNEAFDVEDTFYTIAVDETSPLIYRTIRVPTGGGTYAWTADAIQVEAVPFDGPYPGGTTGSAGQVVARKSSGNGFELVNHNSIAGRSTASAHPDTAISSTSGSAPMFKSAAYGAFWNGVATALSLTSDAKGLVDAILPPLVTDDGDVQEEINDNISRVVAGSLALGAIASDAGTVLAERVGSGSVTGVGLYSGLNDLVSQVKQSEGILDRWGFVAAVEDVANLDLDTLTAGPVASQPTFSHGSLAGIGDGQGGRTHVLLLAQTDPAENRIYEVDAATGQWSQPTDTDVFWPPGNGYRVTLNAPGDDDDAMTWIWQFDDRTLVRRGGNFSYEDLTETDGRWTLWTDPTASGGGLSAGSVGTTELAADAVTFAKMQNISTARLLGRTTSGSGDVEELTAADVKTLLGALPNNLWAHQIIPWLHWKTSGGTAPTRTPSSSRLTGGYLNFATVGTGHWVEWSVGLDAGTWDLTLIYDKLTVYGVYDVSVDGVVVGSFNANGASATNQVFSIPGITVPANGNHTLRLTNTANGAGANTAGLALEAIGLQRTA